MFRKIIFSQFAVPFMALLLGFGVVGFAGLHRGLINLVDGEIVTFKGTPQRALIHRNPAWAEIYEPQQPSITHFVFQDDRGEIRVQTREYNNDYLRFGLIRVMPVRSANDNEVRLWRELF